MNTSNYPTTSSEEQTPRKNSKKATIVILAVALLGTWGYLLINNNKTGHVIEQNQTQIAQISDEKTTIRKSFDESLTRLDSMVGTSAALQNKLSENNKEIAKRKTEIRNILNKKNATAE